MIYAGTTFFFIHRFGVYFLDNIFIATISSIQFGFLFHVSELYLHLDIMVFIIKVIEDKNIAHSTLAIRPSAIAFFSPPNARTSRYFWYKLVSSF